MQDKCGFACNFGWAQTSPERGRSFATRPIKPKALFLRSLPRWRAQRLTNSSDQRGSRARSRTRTHSLTLTHTHTQQKQRSGHERGRVRDFSVRGSLPVRHSKKNQTRAEVTRLKPARDPAEKTCSRRSISSTPPWRITYPQSRTPDYRGSAAGIWQLARATEGSDNRCTRSVFVLGWPHGQIMHHPLDMATHYYAPEVLPHDHRTHRYRSFMIEEILTEHPEHKASAPAGELLKFGVQALLSARPFHNQLGKRRLRVYGWVPKRDDVWGGFIMENWR